MQALILAGGFGTRLSHIVRDVPKPMAPINGKPFLEFQVRFLKERGIKDIVFLTGHKSEIIEGHFGDGSKFGVRARYSVEKEPLGTGGAIKKAAGEFVKEDAFLVLNGDSYFDADIPDMAGFHRNNQSRLTIALKYKDDVSRYGMVRLDDGYRITRFVEKSPGLGDGFINGGIYLMDKSCLSAFRKDGLLSFENEVMPELLKDGKVFGYPAGGRFIDIGVPDDYKRANDVLEEWIGQKKIRAAFLDRDGLINIDRGYTCRVGDMEFTSGVIGFMKKLQAMGFSLVIVTNQAGIAKGKFTLDDYKKFQEELVRRLAGQGIAVLESFYCPYHPEGSVSEFRRESLLRKPAPGMLLNAADRFNIDLAASVMVGDKDSDRIRLPYLRSYILRGNYPVEGGKSYATFEEILEDIKNG